MPGKADIDELILEVMRDGSEDAIKKLAQAGPTVIYKTINAFSGPYPENTHPVDVVDNLGNILFEYSKLDPKPLLDIIKEDRINPDLQLIYAVSALRGATHHQDVINTLIRALHHKNEFVRCSAADTLIDSQRKEILLPLIDALHDDSPDLLFTITEGMIKNKHLRSIHSLELLEKIKNNKNLKNEHPGLQSNAKFLIRKISRENGINRDILGWVKDFFHYLARL